MWALIINGWGQQSGSHGGVTGGTGTNVGSNKVSYYTEELMLTDYELSKISICRDADKNVGYNLRLTTERTFYTDDNGMQYLCYTASSDNVYVEILAPIYPGGSIASIYDRSYDENLARRDCQFGEVEIGWNGSSATLTLVVTGQVYFLEQ